MTSGVVELAARDRRSTGSDFIRSWLARSGPPDGAAAVGRFVARRKILEIDSAGGLEALAPADHDLPRTARLHDCGVVFEGWLDERDELRGRLGLAPGEGGDDAELVLYAYLKWGDEAPSHLEGLFVFVLEDAGNERLLAVRDRMGIYPLFHTATGRERLFATSPELLLEHPRVDRAPHRALMAERLCYRFHDVRETDYRRIFRLPPGHLLVVDRSGERCRRYWNPVPADAPEWIRDDVPARVDALFQRAIDRFLELGPAAIFLSGGLDSVNVAARATDSCRATGKSPLLALSVAFPGKVSEAHIQRGVAQALGLDQVLLPWDEISGGDAALERVTALSPEFPLPMLSHWKVAYLRLVDEGAAHGRRIILTGTGGDEWMDIGPRWAGDLLQRGELGALWRLWRTLDRCYPRPGWPLARYVLWRYGLRPVLAGAAMASLGAAGRRWSAARKRRYSRRTTPTWIAPDAALQREIDERAERYFPDPPRRDFVGEATRHALDSALDAMQKEELFETGRRTGLPLLSPLLDPGLVELLIRVPQEILHRGGMTKALLRDPAVRRFPGMGFDQQRKLGATLLARSFVQEQAQGVMASLGGVRRLAALDIVEPVKFGDWLAADLAKERSLDTIRIWFTFSLESWSRTKV